MHQAYVVRGESRISYLHGGKGRRLLFCFHGYGETAASFAFLEKTLGDWFTLIAIDMPFHGQTEWKEGAYFEPSMLVSILKEITQQFPGYEEGWRLLGYSMGGRIALQLLELEPTLIRQLVLLAPDGLTVHPLYWLSTQTRPGNRLFKRVMAKPGALFSILKIANTLRLVNPSIFKFTTHYIDNDTVRQDLYIRWTTMRGFRPDLRNIQNIIRTRKLPVTLLYGQYDRIITWQRGERFRKGGIADFCRLQVLPTGHQLLSPRHAAILLPIFTDLLH